MSINLPTSINIYQVRLPLKRTLVELIPEMFLSWIPESSKFAFDPRPKRVPIRNSQP